MRLTRRENNPVLRERILGLTAIAAMLIAGAVSIDVMLTSGWQPGGEVRAAPVIYAETQPQYQDAPGRDSTVAPQRRAPLAGQDAPAPTESPQTSAPLDGAAGGGENAAPLPPSPAPPEAVAPKPATQAPDESDAERRFEAIEAEMQQATADPQAAAKQTTEPSR
jgi:hypothetical protein